MKIVTRGGVKQYGRYSSFNLPAGLRCKPVTPYPTQTKPAFWLDEFPPKIFPPNSMILHDVIHYGLWLQENEVDQIEETSK